MHAWNYTEIFGLLRTICGQWVRLLISAILNLSKQVGPKVRLGCRHLKRLGPIYQKDYLTSTLEVEDISKDLWQNSWKNNLPNKHVVFLGEGSYEDPSETPPDSWKHAHVSESMLQAELDPKRLDW